jgi:DNA-binding LacI/PurR family transcriptional regulator
MSNAAEPIDKAFSTSDQHELLVVDRVEHELRRQITRLQGVPGAMLPKQETLVEKCGVSRRSVREALSRLEREKLIRSIRGKGTFVTSPKKTNNEVFLLSSESYPPFEQTAIRVTTVLLKKQGFNPNLIVTPDPIAELATAAHNHPGCRGCLITGGIYSRETVEKLVRNSPFPIITIGDMDETHHGTPLCDSVIPDNKALGFQAADYLIRQGHRRIAWVTNHLEKVWNREIMRGYLDALEVHGITPDPAWVVNLPSACEVTPQTMSGPQRQIDAWFETDHPPTALVHNGNSESRMHDILHMNFHGRFGNEAVVPITLYELLQTAFTGIRDAVAVVVKFEDLAKRAIELLLRSNHEGPPVRETQARIYLYFRRNGVWREEKNEKGK